MTKPECEGQDFEKERIRMADGRELIFYRFPEPPPRPAPPPAAPSRKPEER